MRLRYIYLTMLLLVGLASITVLAQASQVYQSEELNFSLSYPERWNVQTEQEGGFRGIVLTPSDSDWVIVYLMTVDLGRDDLSLEEAANSILGDIVQSYPYLSSVQEPAYVTVGDIQGISAFYKGVDTAGGMQEAEIVWAVVLVQENLGYLFLADVIESQFDKYQADFNEIIGSFKFAPKEALTFTPTFRSKDPSFILIAGDPPLTQKIVNIYLNIIEFALKFQMTEVQKELVTQALIKEYNEGTPEEKMNLVNIETTWNQIVSVPEGDKENLRITLAQYLLAEAQKDPADPLSAMVIDVYQKTNTVLVEGNPPLTQQAVDSFLEMLQFVISAIRGQEYTFSQQEVAQVTQNIISAFPTYPVETRQFISQADLVWTKVRYIWSQADQNQRAQIINELAQLFFGTGSAGSGEQQQTGGFDEVQSYVNDMNHKMTMDVIDSMPGGDYDVYGEEVWEPTIEYNY